MKSHGYFIAILFCFFSLSLHAQDSLQNHIKKHRIAFYGGVGANYYFNNMAIAKNHVNELNYSFVGRLMWEPEYFLSLGLESGYYQLYTINYSSETLGSGRIKNSVIPIQLVASMKFLKNYYANLSMGQSYLINETTNSTSGNSKAGTFSLADFGITLGYKHLFKSRISIGAELKFYSSKKYDDNNLALVFVTGYRF
ncbi:MAG TPA: hypothetical protein VFV08_13885 [Puia sp.]|nr:hypothetical protein [Puia sp.]